MLMLWNFCLPNIQK